jgi:hypothetical protein
VSNTQYVSTHKAIYMDARNRNFGTYVSVLIDRSHVAAQPSNAKPSVVKNPSVKSSVALASSSGCDVPAVTVPTFGECVVCSESHSVDFWDNFKKMNLKDRLDTMKKHGLCLGCF